MPQCKVSVAGSEYDVEYSVGPHPQQPECQQIIWQNAELDELFQELSPQEAQSLEADILTQCGAHWESHSGDGYRKGTAP